MIDIFPLSNETVDEAIKVLDVEFGNNLPKPEEPECAEAYKGWLMASLPNGFNSKGLKAKHGVEYLQYWIAFDPDIKNIVGVTGLFTKAGVFENQADKVWLGWVGTTRRSSDIADLSEDSFDNTEIALIKFSMGVARSLGKRYLCAYLTDSPDDNHIRMLMKQAGFEDCDQRIGGIDDYAIKKPKEKILYYQFDLRLVARY